MDLYHREESMLLSRQNPKWVGGAVFIVWALAMSGCSQELTGPSPGLAPGADTDQITSPSFACNEQVTSWITVSGTDFSPLVVDSIAREKDVSLELPTVTLDRRGTPEGEDDGEAASVTLEEATTREESQVVWVRDTEVRILRSSSTRAIFGIGCLSSRDAGSICSTIQLRMSRLSDFAGDNYVLNKARACIAPVLPACFGIIQLPSYDRFRDVGSAAARLF